MDGRTSAAKWRLRGSVILLVAGLIGFIAGCNPQGLSMMLMPFTDNHVDPDYKLFDGKKEAKLVILASFAEQGILLRDEVRPAESELPLYLAQFFKKRCEENKLKLTIVSSSEVKNYLDKQRALAEDVSLRDVGKHFKADFVLDVNVRSLQIYKPKMYPPHFQGSTKIDLTLYKMDSKQGEAKVFNKTITYAYPSESGVPIDAGRADPAEFRVPFLQKISREVSKLFIPYDPDERRIIE